MDPFVLGLLIFFFLSSALCQICLQFLKWWKSPIPCLIECIDSASLVRYQNLADIISITCLWYSISLSFTLFNKWFMQEWEGGFNYPTTITGVHMLMKFLISRIWSISPSVEKIEPISWNVFFCVALPIGSLTALDIVLSNASILYLPLTLVTAIKGSTLIFTFLWGVFLKIETFQWSLLLAVCGITSGLAIAVSNTIQGNMIGICLILGSAAAGGLRWALMQLLAVRDSQSKSVMVTLYRFSPFSVITILPMVLYLDAEKIEASHFAKNGKQLYSACLLSLFGGLIAFLLIITEVKLLRLTSSLSMSVFGQIKEIIQIGLAMIIFKENLTLKTAIGISISICSSFYYRYAIVSRESSLPVNIDFEEEMTLLDSTRSFSNKSSKQTS